MKSSRNLSKAPPKKAKPANNMTKPVSQQQHHHHHQKKHSTETNNNKPENDKKTDKRDVNNNENAKSEYNEGKINEANGQSKNRGNEGKAPKEKTEKSQNRNERKESAKSDTKTKVDEKTKTNQNRDKSKHDKNEKSARKDKDNETTNDNHNDRSDKKPHSNEQTANIKKNKNEERANDNHHSKSKDKSQTDKNIKSSEKSKTKENEERPKNDKKQKVDKKTKKDDDNKSGKPTEKVQEKEKDEDNHKKVQKKHRSQNNKEKVKEQNEKVQEKENSKEKVREKESNKEKENSKEKVREKENNKEKENSKEKVQEKEKSDMSKEKSKGKSNKDKTKSDKNVPKEDPIISERKKRIEEIGDLDDQQFQILHPLFSKSATEAIIESEKYFRGESFSTFDEYIEDVKKSQKSNCCICSWSKSTLAAGCFDCRLNENSCVCIPCFLAGKHDQHHSYLLGNSSAGNCDCGDPNLWKPSGNCPHHPGPDAHPDISQMTPENRKKFITVFKSAFYGAFTSYDVTISWTVFDWMSKFIQYGDGIRRCCSIAITSLGSKFFFTELLKLERESVSIFIDLLGKLVSDQLFALRMGSMVIFNYLALRKKITKFILAGNYDKKNKPIYPLVKFLKFSFHFFQEKPLLFLIKEKKFNWVDFAISSIQLVLEFIEKTDGDYDQCHDCDVTNELNYMESILKRLMKMDDQHENLQKFVDKYSKLLLKYESKFSYSFNPDSNIEVNPSYKGVTYYTLLTCLYDINSIFCPEFDSSSKNKQFSITSTFSNLVEFLTKEKIEVDTVYKAAPKIPISPLLPLHHLFYCLLSSRKKVDEIVLRNCQKKGIEMQNFCSLASIYPLRLLASLFAPERFSDIPSDVFMIVKEFLGSPETSFNKFFGLYQILLGIAPDKEKMLEDVARTFGVFAEFSLNMPSDDLDERGFEEFLFQMQKQEEIKQTAHFDTAVFIMSILTDRSIITFDKILFKRLRVIELMMVGKPTSVDIETYVNEKISNPLFGDDLSSYSERVTTSNGSYFKLTNIDDFTPFFPLIFHLRRMKIFSKYEDKLIPFLNYTKLPLGLNLQTCFRSQTFIALMFRCLLTENRLMETQVGLSMFILSMLNGTQFDEASYNAEKPLTIECSKTIELINELRKSLTSQEMNFSSIKIKFDKDEQFKSILELVKSNMQLGYEAIRKANLPIQLKVNESNDEEIQKQKKEKAGKLKEQIMKEFESKRNIFKAGDPTANQGKKISETENDEEEENQNENDDNYQNYLNSIQISKEKSNNEQSQCCVCQNFEPEEVIGFPCLSLPCIFPSIIKNKLHNLNDPYETVFSLSICTHPVHFKCCQNLIDTRTHNNQNETLNDGRTFNCMIDRGERNCLLPSFSNKEETFSIKPSDNMCEAMKIFMERAFNKNEVNDDYIPLKSFCGIISTIEVRHRSRPECLDGLNVPLLIRNLFLTLYFTYHESEVDFEKETIDDPLLQLIIKVIKSSSPISEFKSFVCEISQKLEDDYLYEFLRRSAIVEDFAFKGGKDDSNQEEFIDWDEILSFESLLSRFEITLKKSKIIELPLFETIALAEKFVSLYQQPYNLNIFDSSVTKFVDLLTGQVVIYDPNNKLPENTEFPKIEDYMKNVYHNGLAMFLGLTGPNASDVIFSCFAINRLFNQKGFYVDKFGDIDRGFKRGVILTLSHDRLENSLDKLLSGDVILY
ncbi:hypothetical protein M9Y10_019645 [Tritrichomonas musculus]|uniref:UBR-type domain-containing protein n=1 Tax=Tritrichomonas musculus TaxID=1915356 RepID=A0ABR2HHW1_9EUKA